MAERSLTARLSKPAVKGWAPSGSSVKCGEENAHLWRHEGPRQSGRQLVTWACRREREGFLEVERLAPGTSQCLLVPHLVPSSPRPGRRPGTPCTRAGVGVPAQAVQQDLKGTQLRPSGKKSWDGQGAGGEAPGHWAAQGRGRGRACGPGRNGGIRGTTEGSVLAPALRGRGEPRSRPPPPGHELGQEQGVCRVTRLLLLKCSTFNAYILI